MVVTVVIYDGKDMTKWARSIGAKSSQLAAAYKRGVSSAAKTLANKIRSTRFKGRPALITHTGTLQRNIKWEYRKTTDGQDTLYMGIVFVGKKGHPSKSATVQEGPKTTIRAKGGKFLAIPLSSYFGVDYKKPPKPVTAFKKTFVRPIKGKGAGFLVYRKIGNKEVVPIYALKKSVTVPGRLGLTATGEAQAKFLGDVISAKIRKILQTQTSG